MPRPKVKIDEAELEKLYGMQCTDEEVAAFFEISTRTLARRKKVKKTAEVIERAKAKGRVSVRRFLYRQASNGNVAGNLSGEKHPGLSRCASQLAQRSRGSVLDTKPEEPDAGHSTSAKTT